MNTEALRQFKPSGPVAAQFLSDRSSKVKLLRGPIAGGKTVTNIFDGIYAAAQVMPICRDGVIRFKDAVIGSTYGQLERNLYPSWHYWLPKDGGWAEGEWDGGGGRFAQHTLHFGVMRNGRRVQVEYTAIFSAIGELSVEQFVRGFEPSAWYLFEVDQLPEGIIEQAIGRLGRYPNRDMLGDQQWQGYVRGDLNSPDINSWYYHMVEEVRPAGVRQYVQPSGLSPRAENLHNLPPGYYTTLAEQNKHKPRWVRRFILNEYGPSDDGEPVFPEWSDDIHLSRTPLPVLPNRPLKLMFDQGLRAAGLITQRSSIGQLRVLAELVPGRMSPRRFAEAFKRLIGEVAPGLPVESAYADPNGFTGVDREDGEIAWAEIVGQVLGLPIMPAPTVEYDLRIAAVKDELTYMIDGNTPSIIVDGTRCPMLRKGFASEYKFEKRAPGRSQPTTPMKGNGYDNPHDALQFGLVGERGRYGVISGQRPGVAGSRPRGGSVVVQSDFLSGW